MYQPGFDRQLAQIRYAEVLEEAAIERANRKAQAARPKPSMRKLALVFAASAPIMIWIVLTLVVR
jgi:hypothetical protein